MIQETRLAPGPVWTGEEILLSTGIRSRTVQPVASCYTDNAIQAHYIYIYIYLFIYLRSHFSRLQEQGTSYKE